MLPDPSRPPELAGICVALADASASNALDPKVILCCRRAVAGEMATIQQPSRRAAVAGVRA